MTYSDRSLFTGSPPERRALVLLAALAVSGRRPGSLDTTLSEIDPVTLAHESQLLQVHTLIGPVLARHTDIARQLPDDLVLFFRAMHAANRQRLAEGRSQLREIGAALAERDIACVVLKGGADMLVPLHADPAIRYVGDLDILVPEDRAAEALDALRDRGAEADAPPASESSRFDWRGQRLPEHHLPRLVHPDWTFPVEIHIRAGSGPVPAVLDADAVLASRIATDVPGLSVAAPDDRACHLVAHATRHDGIVSLRAWMDWTILRARCDRDRVDARLRDAGLGHALDICDLMADLLEAGATLPAAASLADPAVAREALDRLGTAGNRSVIDLPRFLFRRVRGLALSPAYRRHIAARIVRPGFLRDAVSRFVRKPHDP